MIKLQRDDLDTVINSFPQGSMQRLIIEKLNNSQYVYNYQSAEQLKFEVELRTQIINASKALYRSGMDFATFRETRCNEQYWEMQTNGGFVLKDGVSPSEAIADIFKNGRKYATECATAMVIVYYGALLNVYPQELFDKTFNNITLMNWHNLDPALGDIGMINEVSDNIPGDRRYFKNPDVDFSTPEWQGENVIDLGNGTYYGHGAGIYRAEQIIRMLNENRTPGSTTSAYLMDSAGNPNYKKLLGILERYQSQVGRSESLSA